MQMREAGGAVDISRIAALRGDASIDRLAELPNDHQPVRMALEEDMVMGPDGVPRWAYQRQTELRLIP